MIGQREFALMQPHAYFITTARGFIHDEAALLEALRNKLIAGAGLDVWAKEPPPPDHPLLGFDNVLASPHTAGVTREARANMGRMPPSKFWMRSTACGRRASSTRMSGRVT
jgi:D-3-phosphoglycerate dehydrogenase